MKLACDLIKPWLVPYSEGTLRAHRPSLHAAVRRHLSGCPSCRQDEVLLHKTAMALRQHSQMSASWSGRRSRSATTDVPLSSRVLQSVQAERRNLACRASQTARRAYPMIAYGTSVALLCTFFAFLTQPSIARPWFDRFLPHPHAGQGAKPASVKPPYPMHDPFAVPTASANGAVATRPGGPDPFDLRSAHSSFGKSRTASFSPWAGQPEAGKTLPAGSSTSQGDIQAREAMMTAEQAEETRDAAPAARPAPAASKPAAFGGFVATPFVNPVTVSTSAPSVAGHNVTISNDLGSKALSASGTQPTIQPKAASAPSASAAQARPMPPIPDPVNQDPTPEASSHSSR